MPFSPVSFSSTCTLHLSLSWHLRKKNHQNNAIHFLVFISVLRIIITVDNMTCQIPIGPFRRVPNIQLTTTTLLLFPYFSFSLTEHLVVRARTRSQKCSYENSWKKQAGKNSLSSSRKYWKSIKRYSSSKFSRLVANTR